MTFYQGEKSKVSTPKKVFDTLAKNTKKLLNLTDNYTALETISTNSILFTASPKPQIGFAGEIINVAARPTPNLCQKERDVLWKMLLPLMTKENIKQIEFVTRGQSSCEN